MDKINWYIIFCPTALLAGSIQLNAAEHEHEHHEAHIHGEAQLLLAMEDNTLEMELLSAKSFNSDLATAGYQIVAEEVTPYE
ncbi:MAG: DUF3299 domain-containing protein [Candidatus Thiodiazotropha sp. (ex Lucina pensylvanica)]|nr:DUF3299 domain-containing protein [Candidatus Thiodiazotropha sp. (ex Lucina pensylvanica)]